MYSISMFFRSFRHLVYIIYYYLFGRKYNQRKSGYSVSVYPLEAFINNVSLKIFIEINVWGAFTIFSFIIFWSNFIFDSDDDVSAHIFWYQILLIFGLFFLPTAVSYPSGFGTNLDFLNFIWDCECFFLF